MIWAAGIDIGSAFSKAVIVNSKGGVFYHFIPSQGDYRGAAETVMEEALRKSGMKLNGIHCTVATGVGAASVPFASNAVPEISCHGRGAKYLFPSVKTIIEIGDQASRAMSLDEEGRPTSFVISEKCAAGSGRFLQVMARVLQVDIGRIGVLSLKSKTPIAFGTNCAVFAESEAISRIAEGASKEDLLAGIHKALSAKIISMVERIGFEKDCAVVGGGARDVGLVKQLEEGIGMALLVPQEPLITAALGAALIGLQRESATTN